MKCDNCIKKDVCKISEKYNQTKQMLEDTLLNTENEDVIRAVKMDINCIHYSSPITTVLRKTPEEQHIPSLY